MNVYAITLGTGKKFVHKSYFVVSRSVAGAIARAQKEYKGPVISASELGPESALEPGPRVEIEIGGEKFGYDQPGLLASLGEAPEVLR
jgi:hypothetical protein